MAWKRKVFAVEWDEVEPAAKWSASRVKATPLGLANRGAGLDDACAALASGKKFSAPFNFAATRMPAAASRGSAKGAKQRPSFQRAFMKMPTVVPDSEVRVKDSERQLMHITVEGEEEHGGFPPLGSFEDLELILPEYVIASLASFGIDSPMPIQAQAMPIALCGQNVVGIAKTGSGKTLAYLLPAIVHIEAQEPLPDQAATPIALILAPVRELAVQICEEARKLLKGSDAGTHPKGLWAACLYGGGSGSRSWQVAEIRKGGHIVAATPGRLVDLVESGEVGLERVTYFVLDEADRMLDEGFGDQVGSIAAGIRPDRQTLFFSATWPTTVQELADNMCADGGAPVVVKIGQLADGDGPASREDIVQDVVVFDEETWDERDQKKQETLHGYLQEVLSNPVHKALVFVSRKDLADSMCERLWKEGISAHAMHGGRKQDTRLEIIDEFKNGETRLLVTTDVMGRGLDIPDVSHVVVYDMCDVHDYVHRIGRTARGPYGQGNALTFFEYDRKWPKLAGEFVELLEQSKQEVPAELRSIAEEVEKGWREVGGFKKSKSSWDNSGWSTWKTSSW